MLQHPSSGSTSDPVPGSTSGPVSDPASDLAPRSFARYRSVLRVPGVAGPLASVLAGAAAIGMLDLALLFLGRHLTGSLAVAGAVTGAFGVGNALGLPAQGRLMDRLTPTRAKLVPGVAGAVCGLLLLLVGAALPTGVPAWLPVVLALLAGFSLPATTAGTRVLLRELVADPALRPAAYALLGALFQLGFLLGPALVSGLWVVAGPRAAVLVSGLLATGSGLLFATAGSAHGHPPGEAAPNEAPASRPGGRGVRTLAVGSLVGGLAAGLIGVGVPAVALEAGAPAWGGVLLSVSAVGTLAGGVAFGALWPAPRGRDLPTSLVAAACAALLAAACAGSLPAFGVALFVSGVCAAPVGLIGSALLDVVVARHVLTQAYALLICAQLLGAAAGYAAGGALAGAAGPAVLFGYAAAALAAAAGWALARRRTLG
ncbi:MFS transporter [Streptomyces sp. B6B3]|uniref:MFS transporter n=1 Tax=Streptomyces sp. B6B3 TaxID=3153570 RepID=UPI00325CAFAA